MLSYHLLRARSNNLFEELVEKMAGDSTSMVKSVNPHPLRIDVVKFDDKNNFDMWRCEVIDVLTISRYSTVGEGAHQQLKKIGTR